MNKKLAKSPDMDKFSVFILCHGRPEYNETFQTLKRSGYTGRIVIIVDNLDKKQDAYIEMFYQKEQRIKK